MCSWWLVIAATTLTMLDMRVHQSSFVAMGTTVVALRTRDSIVVATDSREVQVDPTGRIVSTRDDKCKMFEQNGVLFALAGIARSTSDFDAMDLARKLMKPGVPLRDMVSAFQRAARPAIESELRRWKTAPGETVEGVPGLHYLFGKSEGGASSVMWGGIAGFRNPKGLIVADVIDEGVWPGRPQNVVMFGKTAAINRELRKGPIGFQTEAEAGLVALEMIRIEAADPIDGVFVGGPTDVAMVRANGIAWSRQKQNCKPIR